MSWTIIMFTLFLFGCVPFPIYEEKQHELSSTKEERNRLREKLGECQNRTKKLTEVLKNIPLKKQIESSELEDIKKKALEETERKYKSRLRQIQQ